MRQSNARNQQISVSDLGKVRMRLQLVEFLCRSNYSAIGAGHLDSNLKIARAGLRPCPPRFH